MAGINPIKGLHHLPDFEYMFFRSQSEKEGFRVCAGGDIADLSIVRGR